MIRRLATLAVAATAALGALTSTAQAATVWDSFTDPHTFYPLVHDGYRDTTRYYVELDTLNTGAVQVVNANDRVVRTWPQADRTYWNQRWDGRNQSGGLVNAGDYTMELVLDDGTVLAPRIVHVRTGLQTTTHHLDRVGVNTTHRSGPCHFHSGTYRTDTTLTLDAWSGQTCRATWVVRVPANGKHVRYSMSAGANAWLDWGGVKGHSMTRTARGVRFRAWASDMAALDVVAVHVSYQTTRRV